MVTGYAPSKFARRERPSQVVQNYKPAELQTGLMQRAVQGHPPQWMHFRDLF
jgi:hypothetical protein